MGNKTLAYMGLGVVLLLILGTFGMSGMSRMGGRSSNSNEVGDTSNHHGGENQHFSSSEEDLSKHRSDEIPANCRLPDSGYTVSGWIEHLGHHEETKYCLEYHNGV